jgi:hypothetical protein
MSFHVITFCFKGKLTLMKIKEEIIRCDVVTPLCFAHLLLNSTTPSPVLLFTSENTTSPALLM